MELNESYWTERYENGQTGWDIGYAAPAILDYFRSITQKELNILIPGGGNGHEAAALFEMGFENVYLLDLSAAPLQNFHEKHPHFPKENLIHADFFSHEGKYDLIVEQTFFCALHPDLRGKYVQKVNSLLTEEGKLVGLLFDVPLNTDHPPFGGSKAAYVPLFEPYFNIHQMEITERSIKPRLGKELFIEMTPLKVKN